MVRSSASSLLRSPRFSSLADGSFGGGASRRVSEKIAVAVLFERLPVVIPKTDPVAYAFQELSYRRRYPDEVLGKAMRYPDEVRLQKRRNITIFVAVQGRRVTKIT
ncbi:hypothetical protein MUK42_32833 [Musa troglodytarum]|uniref:Uncharacterized protein n=1 Tax=Musa troglodytarum TaxID=320322 RepID=A0A9E7H8W5_9LILI|nr:hypothetical protein MUK42_32833 [Musa troglodytarum]